MDAARTDPAVVRDGQDTAGSHATRAALMRQLAPEGEPASPEMVSAAMFAASTLFPGAVSGVLPGMSPTTQQHTVASTQSRRTQSHPSRIHK